MSKQIESSRLLSIARYRKPFIAGREGGITAMFAIGLPVIVGMAGLAIETGLWYQSRRELQSAADAAALAGALELVRANPTNVTTAATSAAVRNGFVDASPSTKTITHPYAGDDKKVQVVLTRDENRLFTRLFATDAVRVRARAVAQMVPYGDACVLALDTGAIDATETTGTTNITLEKCLIAANSNAGTAVHLQGNAVVNAGGLWTAGGYAVDGSATATFENPPVTSAAPIADPYASLTVPPIGACNTTVSFPVTSSIQLSPGTYCPVPGNFKLTSTSDVDFLPGTYIINKADFEVEGSARLRCSTCTGGQGVTFVLTSSDAPDANGVIPSIGKVNIAGGADIALDAPRDPSSQFNGVLFYQDQRAQTNRDNIFNGGGNMSLGGALYFPRQEVFFTGNNDYNQVKCTHVVGRLVTLRGTSSLDNRGCEDAGWLKANAWSVDLLE